MAPGAVGAELGPLETAADVKREAGKLYHRACRGELTMGDASRLATVLALSMRVIETADIEGRLLALEARETR